MHVELVCNSTGHVNVHVLWQLLQQQAAQMYVDLRKSSDH
jgi:hypothetical protein